MTTERLQLTGANCGTIMKHIHNHVQNAPYGRKVSTHYSPHTNKLKIGVWEASTGDEVWLLSATPGDYIVLAGTYSVEVERGELPSSEVNVFEEAA